MVELLNFVCAGPPMSTRSRAICGKAACGFKTPEQAGIRPDSGSHSNGLVTFRGTPYEDINQQF